ncbi:ComEC/Rec2 family competence protein [Salipiger mangrovisoli]|uniref:ComEC/Rec2 family competence protein n=1 Tax=Salipiger mangrovisoli TaxID=2865933 RepID=A0ABR9WX57_9RHOB|nr:ComEC/Rec2 family competence protein [Salipiger mangrovisoli]MBE9635816.1 ComEC/Rec2 family competence protein [Salipiger mangrovisoli]
MGRLLTLLPIGAGRRARTALHAQRGHLFPWAPVFLGLGIGVYFALPLEPAPTWLLACGIGAALLMLIAPRLPDLPALLCIAVGLVLLGLGLAGGRAHLVAAPQLPLPYYGAIEGRVVGVDRSASDALRLTLDTVVLAGVPAAATPARLRVSLHGDPQLQARALVPAPGQRVALTGRLLPPGGPVEPGGFDFRRHAWFDRIGAVGYSRAPVVLAAQPKGGQWVLRARMALSGHVQRQLPGEIGAFAAALMTGDRSGMGQATIEALRRTNLAHLLAISGLHMGLLTGFVFGSVRLLLLIPPQSRHLGSGKKIAALAALAAATGYLALSGGNVATQRAFIMVAVMLGAILVNLRALSLRAVALAAMVVLGLRPEALLGPGFQMSFAATTALVCVFGAMRGALPIPPWARPVLALVLSSAVASVATAPFSLAHFNLVSRYGLLANLLAVPAMGLVAVPMAVLAAILLPFGLDGVALQLMGQGLRWILAIARTISSWDGAVGQIVAPGPGVLPSLSLGGLLLLLWQGRGRWAGLAPICLGVGLWALGERPALLIAESGALVGVMTDKGRALSRPTGEGFAAKIWLENDGQAGSQAEAAALWPASLGSQRRALAAGTEVLHVTGERQAAALEGCDGADIVVSSAVLQGTRDCLVFDPERLEETGAVALRHGPGGLAIQTARSSTPRLWERGARRSQ